MDYPDRAPLDPVRDALSEVRFELLALNDQVRELLASVHRIQPQITVEPTPVVVQTTEAQAAAVDLSPLLAALERMSMPESGELDELRALRKDFNDLGVALRHIAGSAGGSTGSGSSFVTAQIRNEPGQNVQVSDYYQNLEILPDWSGTGSSTTITFTTMPKLIWLVSRGGPSRVTPPSQTPTASLGIYCDDGVPQPITWQTNSLKVYTPAGATVTAWGYS